EDKTKDRSRKDQSSPRHSNLCGLRVLSAFNTAHGKHFAPEKPYRLPADPTCYAFLTLQCLCLAESIHQILLNTVLKEIGVEHTPFGLQNLLIRKLQIVLVVRGSGRWSVVCGQGSVVRGCSYDPLQ